MLVGEITDDHEETFKKKKANHAKQSHQTVPHRVGMTMMAFGVMLAILMVNGLGLVVVRLRRECL